MKKPVTLTTMLGLMALLAACGEKAETNVSANAAAAAEATGGNRDGQRYWLNVLRRVQQIERIALNSKPN